MKRLTSYIDHGQLIHSLSASMIYYVCTMYIVQYVQNTDLFEVELQVLVLRILRNPLVIGREVPIKKVLTHLERLFDPSLHHYKSFPLLYSDNIAL